MAGSSSAGHAIIYRESALTFEEWDIAELNEQVQLISMFLSNKCVKEDCLTC